MESGWTADHQSRKPFSLRSMHVGEIGLITALRDSCTSARRLAEFGLIRGATVEMIRAGAPCIVRVDHTRLSLGAALQEGVLVSPVK